jgi:phage-related protein
VQIFANNILLEEEANLNFGDIRIGFYIEQLQEQLINVKVNGEDLSYYGAFIEDAQIPEGLDTDTSFLSIDGTDTNDAYRQNIREKTIELEMSIGECDLQTSTDMLRQLTKLLVNEKDEYNRPIPNTIEFSHYPDVYFEYIMTDTMDISTSAGAYTIKAKLTIPAGTAYSKQNTSTNITGFVQGIASVNPVISLKAQDNVITLQETITGQKFTIGYDGDWTTGIIEIDCEERKVYHKTNEDDTEPTDLSKYVDFNSDWFNLHGEYNFNASGCTVRKVEFTERW